MDRDSKAIIQAAREALARLTEKELIELMEDHFDRETDNDNQVVFYTGVYESDK
jgi:hypothetical protein